MELTSEQFDKAAGWHGALTEAAVILDLPFRRCWAYVSGKPVSIRPFLRSERAKAEMPPVVRKTLRKAIRQGHYTCLELVKIRLADLLLSAGLLGRHVQPLLDGKLFEALRSVPEPEQTGAPVPRLKSRLTSVIVVIYDGINDPFVRAFSDPAEQMAVIKSAEENGSAIVCLNVANLYREVLGRVCAFQESREYVTKSPGKLVAEALAVGAKERLSAK